MADQYWAAKPLDELLPVLDDRVQDYYDHVRNSGLLDLWRASHRAAYPALLNGGNLQFLGQNGEFQTIDIGHYGNLKQHILTLIAGQKLSPETKAANTDYASQREAILGNAVIETAIRERNLDLDLQAAAELSLLFAEGLAYVPWDPSLGEDYLPGGTITPPPAQGESTLTDPSLEGEATFTPPPVKTGDFRVEILTPLDVPRDPSLERMSDMRWCVVRRFQNRFDLAAMHPELAEEILKLPRKLDIDEQRPRILPPNRASGAAAGVRQETDDIPVYEFFHLSTPACPGGRHVTMLSREIALADEPNPYDELPVYRMCAADIIGTAQAYATMYDLLGPQQALNNVASTVLSNVAAFGNQAIWTPDGCKIQKTQLGKGLILLEGGQTAPQPIKLQMAAPELDKFMQTLERWMEVIMGVSSVMRGQPDPQLKSGNALALVASQTIQYSAILQKAYVLFCSKVLTAIVKRYQQFGDAPHLATLVGQGNRYEAKQFVGADLAHLTRVEVQLGNPLQATVSGKIALADGLLEKGMVKTPQEYLQVVSTGRLEPLIEGTQKELLHIKQENEDLSNGKSCRALIYDNHPIHIQEHQSVMASPEARQNAAPGSMADLALAHIQEHVELWRAADPAVLAVLHIPPPPPPPLPPGMPPPTDAGGLPPGPPGNAGAPPSPAPRGPQSEPMPATAGTEGAEARGMRLPHLPLPAKDPLSGQRPGPVPPQ